MRALLSKLPCGRILLLLDNLEEIVDPETRDITDTELDEGLRALLEAPQHGVKVVMTSRVSPRALGLVHPGRQFRLDLETGLQSPYAENILREMDIDGAVGLRDASDELLGEARIRTQGNPRALEALYAILSVDRDTSLPEILASTQILLPEDVIEVLVGEAFSRLDANSQIVMEVLAIYGHPVPGVAVDYMLQPYLPGADSTPVLSRLVNMQFVRREAGNYYLHPVDREYALSRVVRGDEMGGMRRMFLDSPRWFCRILEQTTLQKCGCLVRSGSR